MSVAVIRRRLVVRGRVQGVGYRASCVAAATRLAVDGWVRNRDDGTVEVVAQGPPAAVGQLVSWCRRGPGPARVDRVEVRDEAVRADQGSGFSARA